MLHHAAAQDDTDVSGTRWIEVMQRLAAGRGALPPGSYLALYDGGTTSASDAFTEAQEGYDDTGAIPYHLRTPEQIAAFFDSLVLVEPGVSRFPAGGRLTPVLRWICRTSAAWRKVGHRSQLGSGLVSGDLIAPEPAEPPLAGPERIMLEDWLEYHRATLLLTCDGLSGEQRKRRPVATSLMSLHGMIRHLADVERNWSPGLKTAPLSQGRRW